MKTLLTILKVVVVVVLLIAVMGAVQFVNGWFMGVGQ